MNRDSAPTGLRLDRRTLEAYVERLAANLAFDNQTVESDLEAFVIEQMNHLYAEVGEGAEINTDLIRKFLWQVIFDYSVDKNAEFAWDDGCDIVSHDYVSFSYSDFDTRDHHWANALEWIDLQSV